MAGDAPARASRSSCTCRFAEPHGTIASPEFFTDLYRAFTRGRPEPFVNGGTVPANLAARGPGEYYANVTHMDFHIGRLLDRLDGLSLRDEHRRRVHQRQRAGDGGLAPLVRGEPLRQHRRAARAQGRPLRRRDPRAGHRALAGPRERRARPATSPSSVTTSCRRSPPPPAPRRPADRPLDGEDVSAALRGERLRAAASAVLGVRRRPGVPLRAARRRRRSCSRTRSIDEACASTISGTTGSRSRTAPRARPASSSPASRSCARWPPKWPPIPCGRANPSPDKSKQGPPSRWYDRRLCLPRTRAQGARAQCPKPSSRAASASTT